MNTQRQRWLVLALLGVLGCDGLGRAIVSERGEGSRDEGKCLSELPQCKLPKPPAVESAAAPRATSLKRCIVQKQSSGTLHEVSLSECELRTALEPWLQEITGSNLFNVRIVLDGEQRLSLIESRLTHVALLGPEHGEAGRLGQAFISHSRLWGSDLALGELQLLSTQIEGSSLETGELVGDDLLIIDSDLTASHAKLIAINARRSALHDCQGGVLIAASDLSRSYLACSGPLQLYTTNLNLSAVDGQLETHVASFADGIFGIEFPTSLTSWSSSFDNQVFCSHTEQLHASGGSLLCSDCQGPLRGVESDMCTDADTTVRVEHNTCPVMEAPPECDHFDPPRRPIDEI